MTETDTTTRTEIATDGGSAQPSDDTKRCPNCKKPVAKVNIGSSGWYRCEFDHCPVSITNEVVRGVSLDTDDDQLVTDGGATDWYCPDCGERHRTHTDAPPTTRCYTCGDETDWQPEPPAEDRQLRADGGTVRPQWTPTADADGHRCQNCGTQVTRQFARVFGDAETDTLWHCPDCEDICYRDLKQGAGARPDYDPAVDRGQTTEHYPVFGGDRR